MTYTSMERRNVKVLRDMGQKMGESHIFCIQAILTGCSKAKSHARIANSYYTAVKNDVRYVNKAAIAVFKLGDEFVYHEMRCNYA